VIKSRICILIFTSWKNTCRYTISPHNWFFMIGMVQHTTIDVVASHDLQQFLTICFSHWQLLHVTTLDNK
jgi:hypothetical protein